MNFDEITSKSKEYCERSRLILSGQITEPQLANTDSISSTIKFRLYIFNNSSASYHPSSAMHIFTHSPTSWEVLKHKEKKWRNPHPYFTSVTVVCTTWCWITLIIVDKLVYHSDGTPSPIFCYINAYFGYKTSNASNSLLTEENKNGVLAYVVYIYTMSMFFLQVYVCRLISGKMIALSLYPELWTVILLWEKAGLIPMNGTHPFQ